MSYFSNVSYLQKHSCFPKTFNAHIGLNSLEPTLDVIHRRIRRGVELGKIQLDEEINQENFILRSAKKAIGTFQNNVKDVSNSYGEFLRQHCKPIDFHYRLRSLIYSFIEKNVNLYLINNPDNEECNKKWDEFRVLYSRLSSTAENPTVLLSEIKVYLNYIREELCKIDHLKSKNQIKIDNQTWQVFEAILLKDINLLEVPVSILAGISACVNSPTILTTIPYILASANHSLERTMANLSWVLTYCEERIRPFTYLPQDEMTNYSQALLDKIDHFKKKFVSRLPSLYLKDCSFPVDDSKNHHREYHDYFKSFFFEDPKFRLEGTRIQDTYIYKLVETDKTPFKPNFCPSIDKLNFLKEIHDEIKIRLDKLSLGESVDDRSFKYKIDACLVNQYNCDQLRTAFDFLQMTAEVGHVLAILLLRPLDDFFFFYECLRQCCQTLGSEEKELFKKIQTEGYQFFNKPKSDVQTQVCLPDIDKQVSFINKTTQKKTSTSRKQVEAAKGRSNPTLTKRKGKASRNKKDSKQSQLDRTEKVKESEIKGKTKQRSQHSLNREIPFKQTHSAQQETEFHEKLEKGELVPSGKQGSSSEKVLAFSEQLPQLLAHAVIEAKDPSLKVYLRHALMNLEDVSAAKDGYAKAENPSSKLFYLMTMLQGSYFYLEQMLHSQRQHNAKEEIQRIGNGHNLNLLKNQLGQKSLKENKLLSELSLALYWTRSTYEQLKGRENWDQPNCLLEIRDIYEAKDFSVLKIKNVIAKVQNYLTTISDFSHKLPFIDHLKKSFNKWILASPQLFHHQVEINPQKCDELAARCQKLFASVAPFLHPKLNQAICHLNIVKGILYELSQEKISSDQFSLLTRGLLFWENTVIEELLQILYGIETGLDIRFHDLAYLYRQAISPESKSFDKDLVFLNELDDLHNLSRYPFEVKSASKNIHDLILQAELLRERPELGLDAPFELQGAQRTELNYLMTTPLSPNEIVIKLLSTHQKIFKIVEKRILPKIEFVEA